MTELERLRGKLREIDDVIMDQVSARMDIVREVGRWKNAQGIPIQDLAQEAANLNRHRMRLKKKIPPQMIEELTDVLTKYARLEQEQQKK